MPPYTLLFPTHEIELIVPIKWIGVIGVLMLKLDLYLSQCLNSVVLSIITDISSSRITWLGEFNTVPTLLLWCNGQHTGAYIQIYRV